MTYLHQSLRYIKKLTNRNCFFGQEGGVSWGLLVKRRKFYSGLNRIL